MTNRRPSSARWLEEHRTDPYVAAARRDGYRSRAAYKLLELDSSLAARSGGKGLFRSGDAVIELGAAPGGWTQVATTRVGERGRVVALDLLPMDPVPGALILCGDFLDDAILELLRAGLGPSGKADVLLSDMAPNMTGFKVADQGRGSVLVETALDFADGILRPGGRVVLKMFQGPDFHDLVRQARLRFTNVKVEKPPASRDRSAELYLIGTGFRADPMNSPEDFSDRGMPCESSNRH
ncbi:MAG: RlmE family RNA methyltransferase [Magnetococcales bacterium]|nr:RlmE family RNA methyltransferase [Magnetococcales bacterium]